MRIETKAQTLQQEAQLADASRACIAQLDLLD